MSTPPKLVCLGGSMREASISLAALNALIPIAAEKGFDVTLLDVRALDLPMYVPYRPVEAYPEAQHAAIRHLLQTCREADAMVWSSPTYHGTLSGSFKNAIDFLEELADDPRPYLHHCPVGLIVVNDTVTFPAMLCAVKEFRAWPAPTQILVRKIQFSEQRELIDDKTRQRLTRMVDELLHFLHRS